MEKFDESEGRWVTINGTHIFIRGSDLKPGSKTSGRHPSFVKTTPKGHAPMTQTHKDVMGIFNEYKERYDTGHKELKDIHKKMIEFEDKRDKAWESYMKLKTSAPAEETAKYLTEFRSMEAEVRKYRQEAILKTREINAVTTEIREKARNVLFPPVAAPTGNLRYTAMDSDLPQSTLDTCNQARDNLNRFFVSSTLPDVPVWRYRDSDQRSCGGGVGIWLADIATTEVAMHEMGHCIEDRDKGLFARVIKFYNDRTTGDTVEYLAKKYPNSGYRPDERVKKDKWPEEYCGKYYDGTSTEILAMGFTMLWRSPIKFAMKDPEYFNFMVDVCKNPVKKTRVRKPKAPKPSAPKRRKK